MHPKTGYIPNVDELCRYRQVFTYVDCVCTALNTTKAEIRYTPAGTTDLTRTITKWVEFRFLSAKDVPGAVDE